MADEIILLKIDLDSKGLVNQIQKIKTETDKLKESNKSLAAEAKKALEAGDNATYEKNTKIIIENNVAIKGLTDQQRNHVNLLNLEQKANAANTGSYEQLLRQQQIAAIQLKNLEGTLKRNAEGNIILTDTYLKQKQRVDEAKTAIIAFDQGIKDGRTNVGNYTESFTAAIDKTGIFNGQLGVLRETLNGAKSGVEVLKAGVESLKQGFESFKSFATQATGVKDAVGGVGEAGKAAGTSIEGGALKGANSMKVLKIAIASTGIGLLVIAIGALVAAFTKTEEGGNKLKIAFSFISQVVNGLVGALGKLGEVFIEALSNPKQTLIDIGNIIKDNIINRFTAFKVILNAIADFDGKALINGLGQAATGIENLTDKMQLAGGALSKFAAEQARIANLAAENEKRQIEYEKSLIATNEAQAKNNLLIGDLRTLSQDKTKTDKERIEAMREAGKLENENIKIEIKNAETRKIIAENALAIANANGSGILEARQAASEALITYNKLVDDSNDKQIEIEAEASKIKLQLLKSNIAATIGILDDEVKQRALKGEQAFELERQIAKKALDAELADTSLSLLEKQRLRSAYNLKIAEINKQEADAQIEINKSIEDLSIQAIEDKTTREIAAEATATQRKIEALTGNAEEVQLQRELLLQASQLKINEIVKASDEAEIKAIEESNKKKLDATQKASDEQIKIQQRQAEQEAALNQLRLDLAGTLVSGFKQFLGQDAANRKKYGDLIKALSLSEIAINLSKELSAIAAAAAANPANAVTAGAVGATQYAIQSAIAIIRSTLAAKTVISQKFASGGLTDTFKSGGHVRHPKVGLIGEAGAEWVAPNWMMRSPLTAPLIAGLERMRMNGGAVPFANGGFTQSTIYNNIGSISVEDMLQAFSNIPPPVVVVQDINDVQGRVAQVVERASY